MSIEGYSPRSEKLSPSNEVKTFADIDKDELQKWLHAELKPLKSFNVSEFKTDRIKINYENYEEEEVDSDTIHSIMEKVGAKKFSVKADTNWGDGPMLTLIFLK